MAQIAPFALPSVRIDDRSKIGHVNECIAFDMSNVGMDWPRKADQIHKRSAVDRPRRYHQPEHALSMIV